MNRIIAMLRLDGRQLFRDPMLIMALIAPVMVMLLLRVGLPLAAPLVQASMGVELLDYWDFTICFIMLLLPYLMGILNAFMLLDERDENLIAYYAVTPLTKRGYFLYRSLLPTCAASLTGLLVLSFSGIWQPDWRVIAAVLPALSLAAPMFSILLAAFASNKVEGLALSKFMGLMIIAPVPLYFMPEPWSYLMLLLPTAWPSFTFLMGADGQFYMMIVSAVIGTAYQGILLVLLLRQFVNKTD